MEIRTCKNCALSAQERDERSGIQNASAVTTGPVCMCADLDENSDYCCKLWRREDHKRIKNILGAKIQEFKDKDEKKEIYMRIYVSQSEVGKSDKEYIKERKEIIKQIKVEYGDDVEIIGSYVKDKWGSTDKAFFVPGWQDDEDCVKEHEECVRRGIEIIYDGLPEKINREKLLDEARRIVCGDRDQQCGHHIEALRVAAKMWTSYLGIEITAGNVCDMMILLNVAKNSLKQKHDDLVDIAGYAACAAECEG